MDNGPFDCDIQHNNHCLMTFDGVNCRITSMDGLGWIAVEFAGGWPSVLDLSKVDWPTYIAACEEMNRELADNWWKWNPRKRSSSKAS
jgi:hypothetical protein